MKPAATSPRHQAPKPARLQAGPTDIALDAIAETRLVWTKFLNAIPLTPNSLAVFTADGTEYRFVLNGRKKWQEAIDSARPNAR